MDKDYYVKYGAQQDDVFVILKQAVMDEVPSIFEDLQTEYGGRIRFPFHVTCQRFSCTESQLREVVERLELTLQAITPFTLSIDSVQSIYSEFFDCEVLKARAHPADYLIEITQDINAILDDLNIETLYKSPSIWLTVLEGIDSEVPEPKIETSKAILEVDFAIIDQLQVDRSFKRLKEITFV